MAISPSLDGAKSFSAPPKSPTAVRTLALFYNKKLFQEAGLDPNKPPQTLDEYLEAAKKTVKRDAAGNMLSAGAVIDMPGQDLHWWREVLLRRTAHRLEKIAQRLEALDGYIVAYLNLDRVIEIIRTEDDPKAVMMAEFGLSDAQVEAILNMRLRALRRLEEIELRAERGRLAEEREGLLALTADDSRQWGRIAAQLKEVRGLFGKSTPEGLRRTEITESEEVQPLDMDSMIEREAVTVILSKMGWIRAMKGHGDLSAPETLKFKEGDKLAFAVDAHTTDRILVFASDGRMFTLPADRLPPGRRLLRTRCEV